MRYSITRIGLFLLIGILAFGLGIVGCGKSEEAPQEENSTQTRAMVPGTVGQDDEAAPGEASDTDVTGAGQEMDEAADLAKAARDQSRLPADETPQAGDVPGAEETQLQEIPPPPPASEKVARELDPRTTTPPPPPARGKGRFSLQLGSYTVESFAEAKAQELRAKGHPATVESAEVRGQLYYRVFIRGLVDRAAAENLGDELRAGMGLDYLVRERK